MYKDGTVVSGISISGKTMEAKKLEQEGFIKPISISVDADGDVTTLTQSDFEYTFDIDTVLSNVKMTLSTRATPESKTYDYSYDMVDSIERTPERGGCQP